MPHGQPHQHPTLTGSGAMVSRSLARTKEAWARPRRRTEAWPDKGGPERRESEEREGPRREAPRRRVRRRRAVRRRRPDEHGYMRDGSGVPAIEHAGIRVESRGPHWRVASRRLLSPAKRIARPSIGPLAASFNRHAVHRGPAATPSFRVIVPARETPAVVGIPSTSKRSMNGQVTRAPQAELTVRFTAVFV